MRQSSRSALDTARQTPLGVALWRKRDTHPGSRGALVYVARCGAHEALAKCLERQVELETQRRVGRR
jgi:hypothetical protein